MSVLSTLALLVTTAVKSRRSPEGDVSDKAHPRFIAGYDAGLKDGRLEIAELKVDLADARRDRDDWRAQAEAWRVRQEAAAEMGQAELYAYVQAQYAQQASQQQYAAMQQNLQNAQAFGQGNELWCNCVPSRAQVWASGAGDGC